MRKINLVIAGVLLFLNAVTFYEAWQIEDKAKAAGVAEVLGPGAYVAVLGVFLLVFTMVFIYQNILRHENGNQSQGLFGQSILRPLTIVCIMAGYTSLIPFIGFLLSSVIFFVLVFGLISHYGVFRSVTLALLVGFIFFLVFEKILSLPFPRGLLPI